MIALPPLTDELWPKEIADMQQGFANKLNVYRVMAHNPALLRAWSDLREHVVRQSTLAPDQSEVVILRTGVRRESDYEWMHHVIRGLDCGMTLDRVMTIRGPLEAMDPADALLAGAVDVLIDAIALPKNMQAELVASIGVQGMLDLIVTVGFYFTLSCLLNSFDTPIDKEIAARFAELNAKTENTGIS